MSVINLESLVERIAPSVRELCQRRPRAERLSAMHNPWGIAATQCNAWPFLDICENNEVLNAVQDLIGPNIILWDSQLLLEARDYQQFVAEQREGRYWPAMPLMGAVVCLAPLELSHLRWQCHALRDLTTTLLMGFAPEQPLYVIRYMAASSHFDRHPRSAANWCAMQEQPLLNYIHYPLWLSRGTDLGKNDFVTGFAPPMARLASTNGLTLKEALCPL
jgi:hypothetical protein